MQSATALSSKAIRIQTRVSRELMEILRPAAELQDRTLTDFVAVAAREAALKRIAEASIVQLSLADQKKFAVALIDPPKSNAALIRAFKCRRKLLG